MGKVAALHRNTPSKARSIEALMREPIAVEDDEVVYTTSTPRNTSSLAYEIKQAAQRARLREIYDRKNATKVFVWTVYRTGQKACGTGGEFFDACQRGEVHHRQWTEMDFGSTENRDTALAVLRARQ